MFTVWCNDIWSKVCVSCLHYICLSHVFDDHIQNIIYRISADISDIRIFFLPNIIICISPKNPKSVGPYFLPSRTTWLAEACKIENKLKCKIWNSLIKNLRWNRCQARKTVCEEYQGISSTALNGPCCTHRWAEGSKRTSPDMWADPAADPSIQRNVSFMHVLRGGVTLEVLAAVDVTVAELDLCIKTVRGSEGWRGRGGVESHLKSC